MPSRQLFYAWNPSGDIVSITADGGFPYGQAVTWTVSTGARDVAGNALGTAGNAAFTVRKTCSASFRKASSSLPVI